MFARLYFILLFLIIFPLAVLSKELIVTYGDYNAKPYAFIQNDELKSGIIKDIMDKVSIEFNIKVKYINVPRNRVENYLKEGKAHIRVLSNPNWHKNKEDFYWSKPLFKEVDKLVILKKHAQSIKNINDLKDKRIGTILGYSYKKLDEKLQNNELIRDDVLTLQKNFLKLDLSRVDALVDSNILIDYYIQKTKSSDKYIILEENVSEHFLYAMYSKKLPIDYKRLTTALEYLKQCGFIDEVLSKYK